MAPKKTAPTDTAPLKSVRRMKTPATLGIPQHVRESDYLSPAQKKVFRRAARAETGTKKGAKGASARRTKKAPAKVGPATAARRKAAAKDAAKETPAGEKKE